MEDLMCEECGARAVVSVLDYKEVINEDGTITSIPDDTIHRLCQAHRRPSQCIETFGDSIFSCLNSC